MEPLDVGAGVGPQARSLYRRSACKPVHQTQCGSILGTHTHRLTRPSVRVTWESSSRPHPSAGTATVLGVILSDATIRTEIGEGRIVVDPFDDAMVQPSSIDVRLDPRFLVFRNHTRAIIDVKEDLSDLTEPVEANEKEPFILHPGEFVLGATAERFALPDDIVGRVEGKSSLGRLGLLIHTTAGFVDAGFEGQLTLELSNVATLPITLYPGMKIGQLSFLRMDRPAEVPYGADSLGSKYRGQVGPTPSQYWKNFDQ